MVVTERRVRFPFRALVLLAALVAFAFAAPSARAECPRDAGGIGGTGQAPSGKPPVPRGGGKDRGGVGGTGRSERDAGGIGGTGVRAGDEGGIGGTGIVGVITGFGSVCVNGLEVEYDASTPVDANGVPASTRSLAVGQVVVIDAALRGGRLHADRIAVRDVAVGPIERIDATRGELVVLGQHVRIDRGTQPERAAQDLAPGAFVAVSGLRRDDGSVAATRIERAPKSDVVSVTGPVVERAAGGAAVGALAIDLHGGARRDHGAGVALVIGKLDPDSGALRAERIEPAVRFPTVPERLSVEGLVQAPSAKGFRTEHADVDASSLRGGVPPATGTRVIVNGVMDAAGRLRAERIEVVPPEPAPAIDRSAPRTAPRGREHEDVRERRDAPDEHDADEKFEKPEKIEQPEAPEQPEPVEKPERAEPPETPEHVEHPEAPEVEHPEPPELPEVEHPETPEVPEIERPEAHERPEVERPEPPEVHEIERPETPERHEIERPEREERPEHPEHDD